MTQPRAHFAHDALTVLLLLLLPMGMLYPLWSQPLSAGEDDVIYYYPLRVATGQALARGDWPLSDSLTAGRMPILGDPQAAVFFPTTWLFAMMNAKLAYSLCIFTAFALAGVGMWVFLRRLSLRRPACLFGAVAFQFCGFLIAHRVHLSMIQTAALLPWWLAGIELLRARRWAGAAWLAAAGTMGLFAGHWPTVIHMMLIAGAYFAFRARPLLSSLGAAAVAGLLAVAITAPQWTATLQLMQQATRASIGYATAGENSYFPLAGVLWLFPFLFGGRCPNAATDQCWWGPWHHCEMLGYIGLITLILAGGALLRRRRRDHETASLVRTWGWIILGAVVFMLGYYLPTWRLVHAIPVLGVVRCPARMILAMDLGVATLAAIAIDTQLRSISHSPLCETLQTLAVRVLPIVMVIALLLVAVTGIVAWGLFGSELPSPFAGGVGDIVASLSFTNPAVLIPLIVAGLTIATVLAWLKSPRHRFALIFLLLVADLFIVARFVDIPPRPNHPLRSPAASWLAMNAPERNYRVWGLGDPYGTRQAELLLARTNTAHHIATISTYGPFLEPTYARLLGFRIFGTNPDWRQLIAQNLWLRRYNVRYLLCQRGSEYDRFIASCRYDTPTDRRVGPTLLGEDWTLNRAERQGRWVVLASSPLLRTSEMTHPIELADGERYRLRLQLAGTDRGAGDGVRIELVRQSDGSFEQMNDAGGIIDPPRIGRGAWSRHEHAFTVPPGCGGTWRLKIHTRSLRPVRVRKVTLRPEERYTFIPPKTLPVGMEPGLPIYRRVATLGGVDPLHQPIVIYENPFARGDVATQPIGPDGLSPLQQQVREGERAAITPSIGFAPIGQPGWWLWRATLPGVIVWGILLGGSIIRQRRIRKAETS